MGFRILIVDDEPAIRSILSTAFQMAGYEVRTASDGEEAVSLCGQLSFDAVLSDVRMPKMDGHELAHWIAAQHPQTPTVLMSGFDTGCDNCPTAQKCRRLPKPFRPSEAVEMVRTVLGQAS